jgi:RHS repeat-associated protein
LGSYLDATPGFNNPITDYDYTLGGRLKHRYWARTGTGGNRIATTYSYGFEGQHSDHMHGDVVGISYSYDPQSTPSVTYTYDRRGLQNTNVQGGNSTVLAYNLAGLPLSETYVGGSLGGLSLTNGYDQFMRRTAVASLQGTSLICRATNSFDAASRLLAVGDGTGNTATYGYVANAPLVDHISFTNNGSGRMTTSKQYDLLNRLTSISSSPSAAAALGFTYLYDNANQRTRVILADGSYWLYQYDRLGQVISGKKFWSDGTPVAGQQFQYGFDDIGNRTSSKAGGDQNGANLRPANYTTDLLNRYSSREVPGVVDVMGLCLATNSTLTVNNLTPYRHSEYFRQEITADNSSTPLWQAVNVSATNETSVSGHQFVPRTPEYSGYDADGNLTSDGRWNYGWDAENRLVAITNKAFPAPSMVLHFEYDAKGRRIHKQVWNNAEGSGTPDTDVKFLYDGWNLMAVLRSDFSPLNTFLWGSDLSGTPQGAGGVGGLLALSYRGSQTTNCFVAFDGNGNVSGLIDAANGTVAAQYEYGPFGELLRATGPIAKANPFRFSTKYQDDETDLLYYSYRYYNASTGRWLSRDPFAENGGLNLYGFVYDDPMGFIDSWGLYEIDVHY